MLDLIFGLAVTAGAFFCITQPSNVVPVVITATVVIAYLASSHRRRIGDNYTLYMLLSLASLSTFMGLNASASPLWKLSGLLLMLIGGVLFAAFFSLARRRPGEGGTQGTDPPGAGGRDECDVSTPDLSRLRLPSHSATALGNGPATVLSMVEDRLSSSYD
ncbi:MAG: hypothetical protein DYH07_12920 [Armatimonadetes bacterium ATM1]|nr:MAG: hypothetical protein EDM73_12925 [Armatimonadota bacterium]MBC6970839.1 hypothetical protein [Armatimonadota bacterium]MCE7900975.1 hypothetical protein [Armatimonadetes bacterium ATM1]RIJ94264.1 MAG: hypothetical protein DCC45_12885 [Armatimonadota bacterium]